MSEKSCESCSHSEVCMFYGGLKQELKKLAEKRDDKFTEEGINILVRFCSRCPYYKVKEI